MGFETTSGATQPTGTVATQTVDGVEFIFEAHSFKHLDDFYLGETKDLQNQIHYPNISSAKIQKTPHNISVYNKLSIVSMRVLNQYFDMNSLIEHFKDRTQRVKDSNGNFATTDQRAFEVPFGPGTFVKFAFAFAETGFRVITIQLRYTRSVVNSTEVYPQPQFTCGFDVKEVNYNGNANFYWDITSGGIGKGGVIGEITYDRKVVYSIKELNGSITIDFSKIKFEPKTTNKLFFDVEVFTYGHETGRNQTSTIKIREIALIYPPVPNLPADFMDFTDVSRIDENKITITMNCKQMVGRNVRYAIGGVNYKNQYVIITCGNTPKSIDLTNMDQYIYVSAISEINDNTFSDDIIHEITQKEVLSFYAMEANVNNPRRFDQDIEYTVKTGTQISIFPTIPPGVDAIIYERHANGNNGGQAHGDVYMNQVATQGPGYAAVIENDNPPPNNPPSKYKIYTLVANNVVVKRLIFKIISIDTATCKIQGNGTTIEGTIRNVNTVSVNVKNQNNGDITQLKSGQLPENANEFRIFYENNDNNRRYYVKGVGDNAVDTMYHLNPVQDCEVLPEAEDDLTQFDDLFIKGKKAIRKHIKTQDINERLNDLRYADDNEKAGILSNYGIMQSERKQQLLTTPTYYDLFIRCLDDYITNRM